MVKHKCVNITSYVVKKYIYTKCAHILFIVFEILTITRNLFFTLCCFVQSQIFPPHTPVAYETLCKLQVPHSSFPTYCGSILFLLSKKHFIIQGLGMMSLPNGSNLYFKKLAYRLKNFNFY